MNERHPQLALFIDADNISLQAAPGILARLSANWDVSYRRAYGLNLLNEQETLREQSIVPIEVLQNSPGKNASDVALVIDAMEELCLGHCEAICIVSADGDYTRLVQRIREKGITAIVFGKNAAAATLRSACSEFHTIEGLHIASNPQEMKSAPKKQTPLSPRIQFLLFQRKQFLTSPRNQLLLHRRNRLLPPQRPPQSKPGRWFEKVCNKAFQKLSTSDEIVTLEQFGKSLHENHPNLAPAMFGRRRLKPFLERIRRIRSGALAP